jgi:hypothetical protein
MSENPPNRQRQLLIAVGIVLGLLVLDMIAIEPLINVWKAHSADIVRLREQVRKGRASIATADQNARLWKEMQDNALPKDPAQAALDVQNSIDGWARANRVELPSVRGQMKRGAERSAGSDRYSVFECRVDASGSLSSLSHFLYDLERSPMALHLDSLELTSRDESYGNKLTLSLNVSGLRLTPLERELRN